jgi:hypothetical protein
MARSLFHFGIVCVIGLLPMPGSVSAGWITLANDTNQTVVVQESVTVNGQVRKCKPIKLAPGETLREFQPAGGTKKLAILDTGLFGKQLFSGDLSWKDDAIFSIHRDGEKLKVADAATLSAKAKPMKPSETKPPADKKPR